MVLEYFNLNSRARKAWYEKNGIDPNNPVDKYFDPYKPDHRSGDTQGYGYDYTSTDSQRHCRDWRPKDVWESDSKKRGRK